MLCYTMLYYAILYYAIVSEWSRRRQINHHVTDKSSKHVVVAKSRPMAVRNMDAKTQSRMCILSAK